MAASTKVQSVSPGPALVFWVFVGVLAIWLASIVLVPWVAMTFYGIGECQVGDPDVLASCRDEMRQLFGTFGDSFGAVNSLFSGLALAGVVLALFFHSEGAKRVAKPFIIPKLVKDDAEARVTVSEPSRAAGAVNLPVRITVPLHNAGSFPSLNVAAELTIEGLTGRATVVADVPLASNDSSTCVLNLVANGEEAKRFVESLCGDGVKAELRILYDSMEGVRWKSQVTYLFLVNRNRQEDERLLRDAIDGALAPANLWSAEAIVDLEFSPVPQSWSYGEV